MENYHYSRIAFSDLLAEEEHTISKNFMLSDNTKTTFSYFLKKPFIFDGLIAGICLKGSGIAKINFKEYKIIPNSVFIMFPERFCSFSEISDDFLIEVVLLSSEYIPLMLPLNDFEVIDNIQQQPCLTTTKENIESLLELHDFALFQYNNSKRVFLNNIVSAILYSCFMEMCSIYKSQMVRKQALELSSQEKLTESFFEFLLAHYKEERNIQFYADKLCLSPKYLSATIKKITGRPISHWINEAVLIEAKIQLKVSTSSILEISENLNFSHPSFFNRFFKEQTGMTPVTYRKTEI